MKPADPLKADAAIAPTADRAQVANGAYQAGRFRWLFACVLLLVCVLTACISVLRQIDASSMTDVGLVRVLPPLYWAAVGALICSFAICLIQPTTPRWLLAAHVVIFIIVVYGSTSVISDIPRGAVSWRHAGITDSLIASGRPDAQVDAYFNWPGFFMLAAFVTKVADLSSPLALTLLAPLVANLLLVGPLMMIFRALTTNESRCWLATWLFFCANWVNQDYFAPQAYDLLLYLVVLAMVLTWYQAKPISARGQSPGLVICVVLISVAMIPAHQLTPFALLLAITGLVISRRCSLRLLPMILAVGVAGWLLFAAEAYVDGHIAELTAGIGDISAAGSKNFGDRLQGSAGHLIVVKSGIFLSCSVWLLAAVGFLRRYLSGKRDIAVYVLAGTPFLLLPLQPYGGELLLRVFLLTLPFMAYGVASLLLPSDQPLRDNRKIIPAITTVATSTLLVTSLIVARFGNDTIYQFSEAEVTAVAKMYDLAPASSLLVATAESTPWKYQDYTAHDYQTLTALWVDGRRAERIATYLTAEATDREVFVLFTRTANVSVRLLGSAPVTLPKRVESALTAIPGWSAVYRNSDATLYYYSARVDR